MKRFLFELDFFKILNLPQLKPIINVVFNFHIRELATIELKILSIFKTLPITNKDS